MTDVQNDILADEDFDTILSPDIDFDGDIQFERSLLVQGTLSGSVRSASGILLVDTDAVVKSDVKAGRVIVRGEIDGNVAAAETTALKASGRLRGNLDTPRLSMEGGASFNGQCVMKNAAAEPSDSVQDGGS